MSSRVQIELYYREFKESYTSETSNRAIFGRLQIELYFGDSKQSYIILETSNRAIFWRVQIELYFGEFKIQMELYSVDYKQIELYFGDYKWSYILETSNRAKYLLEA